MQKIIDYFGVTVSAACGIHCVLLPLILLIAPYSFLASHEFHVALIYFILPSAALAFFLGCKKHGDKTVAIMGIIGIALLTTSILIHEVFHSEQHSEEMISVLITIAGSVTLIFSHLRNRRLCELVNYECHK